MDSQGPPRDAQGPPKNPKDRPRTAQGPPETAQGVSKECPGSPGSALGTPKDCPRTAQGAPRAPKDRQGLPRDRLGTAWRPRELCKACPRVAPELRDGFSKSSIRYTTQDIVEKRPNMLSTPLFDLRVQAFVPWRLPRSGTRYIIW